MPAETEKRRPRVSLLSLLLLVTVVALALALGVNHRHTKSVEWRLNQLLFETGSLRFSDATRLHADYGNAAFLSFDRFVWRVFVPDRQSGVVRLRLYRGEAAISWLTSSTSSWGRERGRSNSKPGNGFPTIAGTTD